MDRFNPTWPQHWPDLGSTSASNALTSAQLGSIGPNFGPTWLQDGFFTIDNVLSEAMFPVLCLRWAQLGVKLSPKVPSSAVLEMTWTFMCITGLQFGIHLDRFGPNFTSPICANLGSNRAQDSATCAHVWARWAPAQPEPFLRTQ